MLDWLHVRANLALRRWRILVRRKRRAFSRWIENTRNLLHLSVIVLLPLLIGIVTAISNVVDLLPFLLFPPLASGTYTLFAHPESRYAAPRRFVGGLTTGAACGWLALELSVRIWYAEPLGALQVHAGAAAFGIFLTGVITWMLDIEEPTAFSTSLLVLVAPLGQVSPLAYVGSIAVSTSLVASVFLLWRERFYEHREQYLYRSIKGDDHVLIPVRGEHADATVMLGARLAAAHEAGKVVLLDIVEDGDLAETERELLDHGAAAESTDRAQLSTAGDSTATDEESPAATAAERLESLASRVETQAGVPCEVVVAVSDAATAATIGSAVAETNSDLIVVPYEEEYGRLAPHIRELFRSSTDVLVHRSYDGDTRWKRILVPVRHAGDVAHAMIDFAARLARQTGDVSICHCIDREQERREAESMLADLTETVDTPIETRVSRSDVADFLTATATEYDLIIVGASTDRPKTSRLIHRPTFERLDEVDADVAIMDRNF